MPAGLDERLRKVRLVIFDVDGVLTNGTINIDYNGHEIKVFDVQDGMGIVLFRKCGYKTAIISARTSKAVEARASDLGIDSVKLSVYPKVSAYDEVKSELGMSDEQICFIGDDLTDLCLMKRVGLAVAVANAREEMKRLAHYVTVKHGGQGAVREVLEMILKAQGKWDGIIEEMAR